MRVNFIQDYCNREETPYRTGLHPEQNMDVGNLQPSGGWGGGGAVDGKIPRGDVNFAGILAQPA